MTVLHPLPQLPQSCGQVEQVSPLLQTSSPQNWPVPDTVALTDISTVSWALLKKGKKIKTTANIINICVPILRICLFYNIAAFLTKNRLYKNGFLIKMFFYLPLIKIRKAVNSLLLAKIIKMNIANITNPNFQGKAQKVITVGVKGVSLIPYTPVKVAVYLPAQSHFWFHVVSNFLTAPGKTLFPPMETSVIFCPNQSVMVIKPAGFTWTVPIFSILTLKLIGPYSE